MKHAVVFVHNALTGAGLREHVQVIACGKIVSGFDIAVALAIGADLCYSARGMMFALGCIQARRCHANTCPTGITTQHPWRVHGLDVEDKTQRVARFHGATVNAFLTLIAALGLEDAHELGPERLWKRVAPTRYESYGELYSWLEPGALLEDPASCGAPYSAAWSAARSDRF